MSANVFEKSGNVEKVRKFSDKSANFVKIRQIFENW